MKLKDLKKIIAEELQNISAERISEGPCGGQCSWNGVVCCSTACSPGECTGCCMNNLMGQGPGGGLRPTSDPIGKKGSFSFEKGPGMKGMGAEPITNPNQRPPRGM